MKSIAWITTNNSANCAHDCEMTAAVSSKCSSRLLESNRSSPTRNEKSTQAVQDNKVEVKSLIQPPPIPPRTKPSLFLPYTTMLSKFLKTSQTWSAKKAKSESTTGYIQKLVRLRHNSN